MSQDMYTVLVNAAAQSIELMNAQPYEKGSILRAFDIFDWMSKRYDGPVLTGIYAAARAEAAHRERERVELHYIDLVATYADTMSEYHNAFIPRSRTDQTSATALKRMQAWNLARDIMQEMRDIEAHYGFEYMSYL